MCGSCRDMVFIRRQDSTLCRSMISNRIPASLSFFKNNNLYHIELFLKHTITDIFDGFLYLFEFCPGFFLSAQMMKAQPLDGSSHSQDYTVHRNAADGP